MPIDVERDSKPPIPLELVAEMLRRQDRPQCAQSVTWAVARIQDLESRLIRLNELVGFYLRLNACWEGKDICVPHRHRTELRELLEK